MKKAYIEKFTIDLNEGYEMGKGWGDNHLDPIIFAHKIELLAKEAHLSLLIPDEKCRCKQLISKGNTSVYCHPAELSGYIYNTQFPQFLESVQKAGLNVVSYAEKEKLPTEAEAVLDLCFNRIHELREDLKGVKERHCLYKEFSKTPYFTTLENKYVCYTQENMIWNVGNRTLCLTFKILCQKILNE